MIKNSLPILFILVAVGLFYTYIDPTYVSVQALLEQENKFDEALNKSLELQSIRDTLLSRYNTFSSEDIERLNKLLPDHVDNVRLALDIDGIASKYNMRIRNIMVIEESRAQSNVVGPSQKPYNSIILSFSVAATYEDLMAFLSDLERSLRIVDVSRLSFRRPEGDLYEYEVSFRTYWMK